MWEPYFSDDSRLDNLRSLFLAIGSALIGTSVIAFSFILFAMQVNVERMPHRLFLKFSTDKRIIGAFVSTFIIAIFITCDSLFLDKARIAIVIMGSLGGGVLFLVFLWYTYQRALFLINPSTPLNSLVKESMHDLRTWDRRAKRVTPLLKEPDFSHDTKIEFMQTTHDRNRINFFQTTPSWTAKSREAIQQIISFTRQYAEHHDYQLSNEALDAIVIISQEYVKVKGKTFFTSGLIDDPRFTDGFINGTLEHLRINIRIGISRGDEQQIEQTMHAMVKLVQIYARIDYSNPHDSSKLHARLAAGYLSESAKAVVPHNMPDVLMEGVRLMGQSALILLAYGVPQDIVTLAEEIGLMACTGVVNEKYRPVTLVAIEQLANLTIALIRTNKYNINFAIGTIKENITAVAKLFINVPDTSLASAHCRYLGPYYSCTTAQSLLSQLTNLVNVVVKREPNDEDAKAVIRNIEVWAEDLFPAEKELFLLAIEKRSHFISHMLHWIAHVTKLLLAVSNAPACDDHIGKDLRQHANWLIHVLSWVPDNIESVSFVEAYRMPEILFDVATNAIHRDCQAFSNDVQKLLLDWAFKGGKYKNGWGTLEQSLYGLVSLALISKEPKAIENFKCTISEKLTQPDAPEQEIRDRAAREIRDKINELHDSAFTLSQIERAMCKVDRIKLRKLLNDLADILSPGTNGLS